MVEELPHIPDIERLSPRVIRILGGNPSKFTLQGTNTHLIGTGSKRLLLDTAEGKPVWKDSLAEILKSENATLSAVILTHWHPDHIGGIPQVQALQPNVEIYKNDPSSGQIGFEDGKIFSVEGATLRAFHSPGHTTDHMSFILEEENAMFTGDNVLGHGTAVFEDLASYMDSLERMQRQFKGRAYPSHGVVIEDGNAKIKEYIAHRKQRESEALELLGKKSPGGDEWWASMEMVKVIYAKYPEQYWGPAEGSLKQVLKKLEGDGKVRQRGEDGKWALAEKAAL
ncbi:Putative metallo-beta-lactamase, winged helix-like DNA-binding domain superfamily [Septoria linicola]|uniref:Metallo-beta-lactamase, winged helix-like DNA-binding domain superfamily n=1 Tax=Septoria linicola TaxID=215465 RepID=A0A9Q9B8X1_9PEZI|nr:putative metallo-beta-lactamase, winged helix-like DNA-binding domain superfamily [Septoria linicola]USW59457.1 Putative metallo-beta-lactamase, winged helix-like DNA-binding domain superfamily [Septoria linicola]